MMMMILFVWQPIGWISLQFVIVYTSIYYIKQDSNEGSNFSRAPQ